MYNSGNMGIFEGMYDGEPEDSHDRTCDTCGSKYCEGECKPLLIQNSTQLPDEEGEWGGGFARNH